MNQSDEQQRRNGWPLYVRILFGVALGMPLGMAFHERVAVLLLAVCVKLQPFEHRLKPCGCEDLSSAEKGVDVACDSATDYSGAETTRLKEFKIPS